MLLLNDTPPHWSQTQLAAPKISVILPVFNRERTIARAIVSVLMQDLKEFELIVVDDGSTDHTAAIVKAFQDPRIVLLRQSANLGANAARNRGIEHARSEIISFLDSDDEFLPHKLSHIVDRFSSDPNLGALVDSFEIRTRKKWTARQNPTLSGKENIESAVFTRKLYKATPAITARKSAIVAAGLLDETLRRRQDMDLILRMSRLVHCESTSEILWRKHVTKISISVQQRTFMRAMIDMCERHPDYIANDIFRIGLARDFARHFMRLVWTQDYSAILRDFKAFSRFKNARYGAYLLALGTFETLRREFKKKAATPGSSATSAQVRSG